ncbi:MAG: PH domain-containing protein [Candidatus Doudnabacteria bacterium]|nr:PH domain-containing protein [Candidatus Doudnabacteria bacterium]
MFKFSLPASERLLKTVRQSEIVLMKPSLIVLGSVYLPWAFLIKYGLHVRFRRLLFLWTMMIFVFAAYKYVLWLINVYIITDKRLISINYKSIIHKIVLETPIDRIQNISSETKGLVKSVLKIGSVVVQVASLSQPIVLKNLKHPEEVKDFLWKTHSFESQVSRLKKTL